MGIEHKDISPWKYSPRQQLLLTNFLKRMERQFRQGLTSAVKMQRIERTKHTIGQVQYYKAAVAAVSDASRRVSEWQTHQPPTEGPITDE